MALDPKDMIDKLHKDIATLMCDNKTLQVELQKALDIIKANERMAQMLEEDGEKLRYNRKSVLHRNYLGG